MMSSVCPSTCGMCETVFAEAVLPGQDKNRRQKLVERRDEPAETKVCARCNMDKHNSEFYRDASKPVGLQVIAFSAPLLLIVYTHLWTTHHSSAVLVKGDAWHFEDSKPLDFPGQSIATEEGGLSDPDGGALHADVLQAVPLQQEQDDAEEETQDWP